MGAGVRNLLDNLKVTCGHVEYGNGDMVACVRIVRHLLGDTSVLSVTTFVFHLDFQSDPIVNFQSLFQHTMKLKDVMLLKILIVLVPKMLEESLAYLNERKRLDSKFSFEIIIVDDGSTDDTYKMALKYTEKYTSDSVRVLKLARNRGKGAAVRIVSKRQLKFLILPACYQYICHPHFVQY
ncbi:unnamed protein product [Dibothriocephalus latus]|uniref:Glycosyltransferase 2-like domain-containing protein n=1 Tax=Dibothriocephalus latus TaxID=60516 RepID=A0A3P7PWE8_DIBLA|nr:unnamed protein product [Dibothriocephalus latus]